MELYAHALKKNGWIRVPDTKEWEKNVNWYNYLTGETRKAKIIGSNDINLLLDFGSGAYLEGTRLTDVFRKKIKRGHNVDISDKINVIMINGCDEKHSGEKVRKEEWRNAWIAFEEAANTRNTRTLSNLISLCRYSLAIADYLEMVGHALNRLIKTSIHWMEFPYLLKNKLVRRYQSIELFDFEENDSKS